MPLETASFISDLNTANPDGTVDTVASLDNHVRLLKTTIKATFPNVTGALTPTHTELNYVDGVTSAIQTQLDAKAALASPALTGTPTAPTASVGTGTTQIATTAFVAATALVSALPGQTGNSGKFVTTDGTNASWADPLPSQTGNSGKFLTTNGTDESWGAVTPSGLVLLATLTPTVAANVDALSAFTSSYDNYLIVGQGLQPSVTDSLRMQLGNAGAADAGSNYYIAATATANVAIGGSTVATGALGMTFAVTVVNANSTRLKSVSGKAQAASTAANINIAEVGAGYIAANAVSGVRLFWAAGNTFAAAGTVRIYGYNNS